MKQSLPYLVILLLALANLANAGARHNYRKAAMKREVVWKETFDQMKTQFDSLHNSFGQLMKTAQEAQAGWRECLDFKFNGIPLGMRFGITILTNTTPDHFIFDYELGRFGDNTTP